MNGIAQMFGINVIDGGFGCNYVLAQVNMANLLGSCQIYGIKGSPVDCRQSMRK